MKIYEQLSNVQHELKCNKSLYNNFGKYSYRSTELIMEAAKPLLFENDLCLTITDSIELIGERFYIKATATIKFDVNKAVEVADAILNSVGELTSDEFNDKIYELENKIEELEAALQDREDRIDYMRRHETYVPF